MKKIFYFIFAFTILGCSSDDDQLQTFRSIYSNTFWSADGGIITFSNDKLFSVIDDDDCYYWKEGSYDNVDYDGCTYDNVTYSVIEETIDKLVLIEVTSDGVENGSGSNCDGEDVTFSFEVLSDNIIRITISDDDGTDTISLVKENSSFSLNGCLDGALNGHLL